MKRWMPFEVVVALRFMREGRMRQQIATRDIGHSDLEQLYLEQMRD